MIVFHMQKNCDSKTTIIERESSLYMFSLNFNSIYLSFFDSTVLRCSLLLQHQHFEKSGDVEYGNSKKKKKKETKNCTKKTITALTAACTPCSL